MNKDEQTILLVFIVLQAVTLAFIVAMVVVDIVKGVIRYYRSKPESVTIDPVDWEVCDCGNCYKEDCKCYPLPLPLLLPPKLIKGTISRTVVRPVYPIEFED